MTDAERDRLRALQDRWLALDNIQGHLRNHGEDTHIGSADSPTFREVRTTLQPEWAQWFQDFFT